MAHAHKKSFSSNSTATARESGIAGAAASPLAFWSNIAEMQRQYFSSIAGSAGEKADPGFTANITELRPGSAVAPAALGQNWMAAAAECQREIASFVNDRLAKNQAFLASAVAAQGVQDLVQLHAGWMQQTTQDYTSEIGKLTDIVKNGADEAIAATA
jgi:hypothetical protein